ncbi:lipocalin family protein [Hymenobacter sp. BT188]|uniref:lipocalin family protein n=1 Tax=Hymenobacter sp. BT188 TaxID=2763504 RepID=UPI00165103CA|nr:lipocalin family protein [Hymenobacter sp. BT188]MBC6605514.1 lipocalin family protein [Hymenobacter sp. BT188]
MKTRRPVLFAAAATVTVAAVGLVYSRNRRHAPLAVAEHVDLGRYMGVWYEIARLPTRFEKGCQHVTAEYSLRPDGKVAVINSCRKNSPTGPLEIARGVARVVDSKTNAKLKVSFFWPFEGDYWILDLDPEYQYALVGEPGRENLWLFSRTPQLAQPVREQLIAVAQSAGFPVEKLIFTPQPAANLP